MRFLGLLLLTSCAAQVARVEHPLARVEAPSEVDASFVAWAVHTHGPRAAAMLGVEPKLVEVEVRDGVFLPNEQGSRMLGAYCVDGSIVVSQAALQDHGRMVVHELVHAYLDGVAWHDNLPSYLREGVAEFVSCYVTHTYAAQRTLLETWPQDSEYARGFLEVDRVGLKALIELAQAGEVTQERLAALPTVDGHMHRLPR